MHRKDKCIITIYIEYFFYYIGLYAYCNYMLHFEQRKHKYNELLFMVFISVHKRFVIVYLYYNIIVWYVYIKNIIYIQNL